MPPLNNIQFTKFHKLEKIMIKSVSSVKSVCFSINKSNPPQLGVTASGTVSSSGWSDANLIPRVYVAQPEDGIQEFDFVASAPTGTVLWVISPLSSDCTIQLESWMVGIRVHSATGSITALLSDPSCAVGQGILEDHFIPRIGETVDGPKDPRLAGGNGGPTGRPGGR
jgi:hypothetical protein